LPQMLENLNTAISPTKIT